MATVDARQQQALLGIREMIEHLCRSLEDDSLSDAEKDAAETRLEYLMDQEHSAMIGA
jgi:hypothetical protein